MRNLKPAAIARLLLISIMLLLFPALGHDSLSAAEKAKGDPNVKVWVNTKSGVYHCPGTKWYGKSKEGKYMTQKEAQEKGYHPSHHKVCW